MNEETRELDGLMFQAEQMPFRVQRKTFVFLSRKVAPALEELFNGVASTAEVQAGLLRPGQMAKALRQLTESLSDEDLNALAKDMGLACKVQDPDTGEWVTLTSGVQDRIFRGKLATFFAWLVFCIEVNFSDFFTVLGSIASAPSGGSNQEQTLEEDPEES